MTRQEALNSLYGLSESSNPEFVDTYAVEKLIDAIFDDFESRVCKSCEYYDSINEEIGYCNHDWYHEFDYVKGEIIKVNKNFGCNKFERRGK